LTCGLGGGQLVVARIAPLAGRWVLLLGLGGDRLAEFAERNRLVFPEAVAERWPVGTSEVKGEYNANS